MVLSGMPIDLSQVEISPSMFAYQGFEDFSGKRRVVFCKERIVF